MRTDEIGGLRADAGQIRRASVTVRQLWRAAHTSVPSLVVGALVATGVIQMINGRQSQAAAGAAAPIMRTDAVSRVAQDRARSVVLLHSIVRDTTSADRRELLDLSGRVIGVITSILSSWQHPRFYRIHGADDDRGNDSGRDRLHAGVRPPAEPQGRRLDRCIGRRDDLRCFHGVRASLPLAVRERTLAT